MPLRFLVMFLLFYIVGFATSKFFIFSAQYLGEVRLIFVGLMLSFVILFLFSWMYFKKAKDMAWRERIEVIAVWIALMLILDFLQVVYVYKASITDLGIITVAGYGISILTLFVTAYITSSTHPKFAHSPNLMEESGEKE